MTVLRIPDTDAIRDAAAALRRGDLVVFPTETVYGLGADATNAAAITMVYAAKGRPPDNPLIVHVADAAAARALAREWPAAAQRLADAFWPGPLTLVLPRRHGVTDAVAGALDTVAVRVPSHPVARALLAACGVPVAAPSANTSGRPSPTRASDAFADLGDKVAVYLDGGPTDVGLESTVVRVPEAGAGPDSPAPTILRLGGISRADIERVVGPVALHLSASQAADPVASPGMKYRHYAPQAVVRVGTAAQLRARFEREPEAGFIASTEAGLAGPRVRIPGARGDGAAWAHHLFAMLRDLDTPGRSAIYIEAIPEAGLGASVMDRVRKAAEGHVSDTAR